MNDDIIAFAYNSGSKYLRTDCGLKGINIHN